MAPARILTATFVLAALLTLAPQASSYDAATVVDGATIQGKVVFTGTPPSPRKVIPTKDREVCGSGVREVEQIPLSPNKAVQDVVVFLRKVEKGKAWPKAAQTPALENLKCDFVPHVQVVRMGSDLEIVNSDPVLHNTHGFLEKLTVFNLAMPNQGQRIKRPLKKSGLVRVECDAHGWMLGWVYVVDNPYYAVTAKDGAFTIKDVPPGSYTLVAWQEYAGFVESPVTVKGKEVLSITVDLKK